ncbi:uncharacterized protein TNCT_197001 [Trichonephila clavata]|uniref:Uncharacterized protein n=1 Tax=Trichonephila clavata TaxID=2740835 RepID=A0A8X6JBU5_TRICU|nr:uncharacterized protein TNCT_197001 [Trichonephila clavata]
MTSLDSEPQVDDQTVIMEDVSVPILTDQEKCAMLTSLEKQSRVLSTRKDYVTDMTEIENAIPSKTEDVRQQLEEEAANLDEKIKFLEGKMSVLLPCPVPLCKHNFKYKSNRKRMAELIIKPAKLNPKQNPKIAKTEENKTNDFKIPRKTAKTVPVETNTEIPTNNSFAALNTANKDAEEVITPKIRPIMMKLFNNYNLVLQNLHKTHPTATNTHVGGKHKTACIEELQAMPDHHPEDPFYARAATELQDIEEAIQLAVSDIDSFPPCVTPGCPHHENNSPPASPSRKENNQTKRKDLSEFAFPPIRKTARKINLDLSQSVDDNLISTNKFALPENNLENPGLDSQTEIDQELT